MAAVQEINHSTSNITWAIVVARLVERSLPKTEAPRFVDCDIAEIGNILPLCRNATVYHRWQQICSVV